MIHGQQKNRWLELLKIEHPVTCLATVAYVYSACAVHVTIFSSGGKFWPVSNFTELHTLTLAAHSYALLLGYIDNRNVYYRVDELVEITENLLKNHVKIFRGNFQSKYQDIYISKYHDIYSQMLINRSWDQLEQHLAQEMAPEILFTCPTLTLTLLVH